MSREFSNKHVVIKYGGGRYCCGHTHKKASNCLFHHQTIFGRENCYVDSFDVARPRLPASAVVEAQARQKLSQKPNQPVTVEPIPQRDPTREREEYEDIEALRRLLKRRQTVDLPSILAAVKEQVDSALAALDRPQRVVISIPERNQEINSPEIQHSSWPTLAKILAGPGSSKRLMLVGPAGTGKTHAAETLVNAVGGTVFLQPPVIDSYALSGFRDAAGNYQETQFYRWVSWPAAESNPAVLILDELDKFTPEALAWANAALANGWCVFPTGQVALSEHHWVIATANTAGREVSDKYVTSQRQDQSVLDRFSHLVDWPLDESAEEAIAHSKYPYETTKRAASISRKVRSNLSAQAIDLEWGPRRTYSVAASLAAGFETKQALILAGLCVLDSDQQSRVMAGVD